MDLDRLYHDLLNAQLDKNWGKVAKIQLKINELERAELRDLREDSGEERESPVEPDSPDVRDHEGAVR